MFTTRCRCIFPLIIETTIQIRASPRKNGAWEGRYSRRLAGLVQTMKRKDIANITISAISVNLRNLRLSINYNPNERRMYKNRQINDMVYRGDLNNVIMVALRPNEIGVQRYSGATVQWFKAGTGRALIRDD